MSHPQSAPVTPPARPVFPSDRTRSARRRAQKEAALDARQKRYLDWAQKLLWVAEEMDSAEDTDLRQELQSLVRRVRLRGARNEQQDFEQVMEAILRHGCHCVEDIHDQTRIAKATLWKILDGFVANGQLEERSTTGSSGRTRDDLDTLFYPTNSAGFSPLIRP
jgi:hypothetical protein